MLLAGRPAIVSFKSHKRKQVKPQTVSNAIILQLDYGGHARILTNCNSTFSFPYSENNLRVIYNPACNRSPILWIHTRTSETLVTRFMTTKYFFTLYFLDIQIDVELWTLVRYTKYQVPSLFDHNIRWHYIINCNILTMINGCILFIILRR